MYLNLQVNKLTMDCDDLNCTVLNLGLFWFIEIIDLIDWIIFSEIYYLIVYMYQFTSFKTMDYKWPDCMTGNACYTVIVSLFLIHRKL